MKHLTNLLWVAFLAATTASQATTLLTFDELPAGAWPVPGYAVIPNGYGELKWENFGVIDALNLDGSYGYRTGLVSPRNVAFNLYGTNAAVSVSSGLFDLDSGYLTSALNMDTNLAVRVEGFRGATLLYDHTYTVTRAGPSFITFNYLGIDRATFDTTQQFALDNLTVAVPEPGLLPLFGLGVVLGRLFRAVDPHGRFVRWLVNKP